MTKQQLLDAGVEPEVWASMRMLTWSTIAVAIIYSPIVVLTGLFYGWRALDYFFIR
jgi:hypothetical protein